MLRGFSSLGVSRERYLRGRSDSKIARNKLSDVCMAMEMIKAGLRAKKLVNELGLWETPKENGTGQA